MWSDGVPISAADFKYAWEEQRGDPVASSPDVTSIAGYRDIASVTGSNGGHTVTVKFKNDFADWKSLFDNLVPAHVMEKVGWSPSCTTVDPTIDLSGGPFKIGSVSSSSIRLVQNPKWWGTPANAKSITVHIASSTDQLAQWMSTGYIQVAQPSTVTPAFLTEMTGLPGAESDVENSNTLLQLNMASALTSKLSPDLRAAIALTINRQALVNQQVSWAVPGVMPADSHVYVQGQASYKPSSLIAPDDDGARPDLVDLDHGHRGGRQRELPGDAGAGPGCRVRPAGRSGQDGGHAAVPLSLRRALPAPHGGGCGRPMGDRGGADDP